MRTRAISKLNSNDVEGAVLAVVALDITQPKLDDEYADAERMNQVMDEYCPLLRVPEDARTPVEEKAAEDMRIAIINKAARMLRKLLSSKDPLLRALAGKRLTIAE